MKGVNTTKIILDDNWYIDVDEARNHTPMRKKTNKKTGEDYYVGCGYYGDVDGAVEKIISESTIEKAGEEITLADYVKLLREERKRFRELLEKALKA